MPAKITLSSGRYFRQQLPKENHSSCLSSCLYLLAMCLYTYHHYPVCGHISNWSVTSCLEFTNFVRQLAGTGRPASCNQIDITHDLLPATHPSLCFQCELQWSENVLTNNPQVLQPKPYLDIEGLSAKSPVIEFEARMPIDVRNQSASNWYSNRTDKNQYDIFADVPLNEPENKTRRAHCSCHEKGPCSLSTQVDQTTQTEVSAVGNGDIMLISNSFKQSFLDDPDDEDACESLISKIPDISRHALQDELITDICKALGTAKVTETPRERFPSNSKPESSTRRISPEVSKSANTADRLELSDNYSSRHHELPIFMSHNPYDWISHLGVAPDFLEGEQGEVRQPEAPQPANVDDTQAYRCASASADPSRTPTPPARVFKPVVGRECTPHARPQSRFDHRFRLMPRENQKNGLGLSLPQDIENYLEQFFRNRFH